MRSFGNGWPRWISAMLMGLVLLASPRPLASQADSVSVVAGPRYRAGALQRWLLGSGYRELWTTPIRAEVLDLSRFAGGLTPVEVGGHKQTRSLRLRGAGGWEYNFRSVDKEVTHALPPYARETLVDWLIQDQISAMLPAAPLVATGLLDAVGVLNPGPRLVVMPDDPRLGDFRAEFAGMLGTLEVHPNEGEDDQPLFANAPRVADTETVLEHLREEPEHRVDSRAFLQARLVDLLIGDWDRHAGQWRWARFDEDGLHRWVPVPEDRDYAFVDHDGLLPSLARRTVLPRLIRFRDRYPDLLALMDNSLGLNRRLLAELPRPVWDSIAGALQAQLTDPVLEEAVGRLPPAYRDRAGAELLRRLRARRDRLPEAAAEYYRVLAHTVEIHGTDEADRAEVARGPGGTLSVRLHSRGEDAPALLYDRTFHPEETKEVRIFLHGGADRGEIHGGPGTILVRVVGGEGDDVLVDRSGGPSVLYDAEGENQLVGGARTRVSRERFTPPGKETILPGMERDWGSTRSPLAPRIGWEPHAELVVEAGPVWTRYGFRHHPYARRVALRALVAPLHGRGALALQAAYHPESSPARLALEARASNLEAVRFAGFGNDTRLRDADRAVAWQEQLSLEAGWERPITPALEIGAGGVARYTGSSPRPGTPAAVLDPYGSGGFGQLGAVGWVRADARDDAGFPRRGARMEVEGIAAPPLWDVREAYARVDARAAAYAPLPLGSALAVRAGGARVFGQAPFFDAAFLGGAETLRGYPFQRYAGDAALFGGVELRLPLTEVELLVRGALGVSLLADAGRVFVDGRSPGGWHSAPGAGVWFASPVGTASLTYARGEVGRFYLQLGMPY